MTKILLLHDVLGIYYGQPKNIHFLHQFLSENILNFLALDKLLDKEQIKEFKLEEEYDGVFYRFNRKGPENSKNEFEENLE